MEKNVKEGWWRTIKMVKDNIGRRHNENKQRQRFENDENRE